jgi:uncharacterized protein
MLLDVIFVVALTSVIQSIFGVGVLLFGTPILLVLGYDFIESILVLLPISLVINLLQVIKGYKEIDVNLYQKIIFFSVPFIILFLFFVAKFEVNIELAVGGFLFFIALKEYFPKLNHYVELLMSYEKIYLIFTGIIHGATNLGGSLLTAIIHSKKYEKTVARATVAVSYASFAFFQLLTLLFVLEKTDVNYMTTVYCLPVGVIVFLTTETMIYMEISNQKYNKLFSIFLFGSGVLVCLKSI